MEDEVLKAMDALIAALQKEKPNDRSERDRVFAILKTDAEKMRALYMVYGS